ncbi:hypothetical protein Poli38472_005432 [Pythium oligandrum]|uniref:Programmed cell death protein 2 C-terminal domain-containing protein n=1 Tax=Pythium oligandrum TaxID=41045 RepID=A0A8K1CFZ9_PYTOL|nr:hypothetical protein Poli38472_005432 [Pythium oligandrum]|eukprot:TMW62814.1 hypothetical protein Poli38472_005432 [Pythium oligandrum]
MDDERVVLLGVVQEKHAVHEASPYICKAGGRPAWYGADGPSDAKTLTCQKCKQSLFHVAQVYAPVESDRTLYVFGCNSPECTDAPGSWRVFRDQVDTQPLPAAVSEPAAVTSTAAGGWAAGGDDSDWSDDEEDKAVSSVTEGLNDLELLLQQRDDAMKTSSAPVTNGWEEEDDDSDWSGDEEVNLGAGNTGTLSDLESLLQQRDDAMAAPIAAPAAPVANAKPTNVSKAPAHKVSPAGDVFPSLYIDVIDEPFVDYAKENDFSHENELLQEYMRQEEEEKSNDVNDLRRIIASTKKSKGDAAGSAAAASSGESYERTPAQQKHFMRFQKRISRCPLQVLRYDYGGEPLWPAPPARNLKVPRCPCGEERAFEFQLTPTINYFLKVDEFAAKKLEAHAVPKKSDSDAPPASAPTQSGGGMDWASVVVYSCPKSCQQSREEFAYVQPAQPGA